MAVVGTRLELLLPAPLAVLHSQKFVKKSMISDLYLSGRGHDGTLATTYSCFSPLPPARSSPSAFYYSKRRRRLPCRLAVGVSSVLVAWGCGAALFRRAAADRPAPAWWLALCWFATFSLGLALHLALSLALVTVLFDRSNSFVHGALRTQLLPLFQTGQGNAGWAAQRGGGTTPPAPTCPCAARCGPASRARAPRAPPCSRPPARPAASYRCACSHVIPDDTNTLYEVLLDFISSPVARNRQHHH